ncbi:AMP-binding protein [Pseudomonas sp. B21-015]|uniref:AMP-binding protein n=1 Tax=Pseudomonas sp. B21-015 TaxID=2895473 RepID=UPI002160A3D2|nr:AMP-binding protein [Pseudomonas sp. B21-015]UVM52702.1 AMP-binding protein [Pseudomonas sp. B21-015]
MPTSLAQVLARHACSVPDQVAFRFLNTQGVEVDSPTYRVLAWQVCEMAGGLLARGLLPGQPIVLACGNPAQFIRGFLAIVHAGGIAVPVPVNGRRRGRLEHVLADCQPFALLLSDTSSVARHHDTRTTAMLIAVDELVGAPVPPFTASAQDVCFIQYTSGSTSAPKGVVVTHRQLAANSEMIASVFGHDSSTRFASWLPLFHDMGLVGAALHPLLIGAQAVLMPTEAFQDRPERWLKMISDYRAHTSGAPDFAYRICATIDDPQRLQGIDLSSWRVAYNGAEPVRAATLERFAATMAGYGFDPDAWLPCYGLAETTLLSAGHRQQSRVKASRFCRVALEGGQARDPVAGLPVTALISSGAVAPGADIRIVDPNDLAPLAEGRIGEIWVAGEHVASRYWGASNDAFGAHLAGNPDVPYLRTGDLGFLSKDELYVTGRLKDMMIIAGRNIYPGDIEDVARDAHPLLAETRVVAVALTSEQFRLCMGHVSHQALDTEQLVLIVELPLLTPEIAPESLAQAIAHACEHPLGAIVWVARADISVTTSGKIQRAEALRKMLANEYRVRAVWLSPAVGDSLDAALAHLAQTLGARGTQGMVMGAMAELCAIAASLPTRPEADLPLLALGLNSLAATQLFARMAQATGIRISLAPLYDGWSLAEFSAWLRKQQPPTPSPTCATDVALLAGQRSILQRRVERGDGAYALALAVSGPVQAIDHLTALAVELPNQLRALGLRVDATPAGPQVVFVDTLAPVPVTSIAGPADVDGHASLLHRCCAESFDLTQGPLQLVRIHAEDEAVDTLLVRVHHIAVDFWSMLWIARYLLQPSSRNPAPRQPAAAPVAEADLAYWRSDLATLNPTQLPRDCGTAQPTLPHCIPFTLTQAVFNRLGQATGQTPFVSLLTCVFAVLGRWTGNWDAVIGVPVSDDPGARQGYGIRVAPIRAELAPAQSFIDAAGRVGHKVGRAFVHGSVSLEQIGSQWRQERSDVGSLFEVAAVHVAAVADVPEQWGRLILRDERSQVQVGELTLSSNGMGPYTLEQPIEIISCETAAGVEGVVRVDASCFSAATARRIAQCLERMSIAAAESPMASLQALVDHDADWGWQTAPRISKAPHALPAMIREWVASRPNSLAIQTADETLSYRQLDEYSDRVARQILQRATPTVIAVRSGSPIEWLVGLVAGLKTGAAIMPLDSGLPVKRQQALLALSASDVLLESQSSGAVPLYVDDLASLTSSRQATADSLEHVALPEVSVDSGAYLIFTSGSTGQPKGVRQSHTTFSHFLEWQVSALDMVPGARVAQIAAPGFDVALCEIFGALCHGATLVLPDRAADLAPGRLLQWLDEVAVTTLQITPSLLGEALRGSASWPRALKTLATVGEPLSLALAAELLKRGGPDLKLINIYGPTETVAACWHRVTSADLQRLRIPVGRPIAGRTVEVRDSAGQPVPVGVQGEIYLRTADMSNGYAGAIGEGGFVLLPSHAADGRGLYRTGDVGRWTADAVLEVLGRQDNQIKLNGVRIELEEVESALVLHPAVYAAVAALRQVDGSARLVAHVEAHEDVDPLAVRRFVLNHLPLTAVPSLIVVVSHLPRTSNGKLDRRALASCELPSPQAAVGDACSAPDLLLLQGTIAALWHEVLPHEEVPGAHTDFFGLGGHSIHAMQMLNLLKTRTGIAIGLAQFLAEPTVSALASLVHSHLTPTRQAEVN